MHKTKIEDIRKMFIGLDSKVTTDKGKMNPINLDNAATTPVLKKVMKYILEVSENYSSIARGDGQKSQICSDLYDNSRDYILEYFKAPKNKYTAIFVNNTTEGINKLSNILLECKEDIVVTTRMEHHSNDLPWRDKCDLKYVDVDENGRVKYEDIEEMFDIYGDKIKYITITGASNVTGYLNDIRRIARLAHKNSAKIIVDGAQLVPHREVYIKGNNNDDIDFLVFSAHKIYAPFGSGAIIGLKDELNKNPPDIRGGGTVEMVLDDREVWLNTPEKNEAGSPNFFGVIALVKALKEIRKIGFDLIEENEKILYKKMVDGMKCISRVKLYGDNDNIDDRVGILIFNIDGIKFDSVGEMLANISAIAVRQGGFCAHTYTRRMLGINNDEIEEYIEKNGMPGMVRASLGMYNSLKEVDKFLDTIEYICKKM